MAVLAHVVALLRSGCPPERAWREAAGVPTNAAGVPLRPALEPLTSGRPVAARAADAIVAASTLSADVGAPLAEVLERVHAALETEDEMAGECAAALAGPRASARILSWLPIAGLVLGMVVGADPVGVLTDGGLGSAVMVAGLACHFLGRATTARMVRSAERAGAE